MSDYEFVLVLWVCMICIMAAFWGWASWQDARFDQMCRNIENLEKGHD